MGMRTVCMCLVFVGIEVGKGGGKQQVGLV